MRNLVFACVVASLLSLLFASSGRANDWLESGRDPAVHQSLDGKIITLRNEASGAFLRQGYSSERDDKRNVEADKIGLTAPRGKGYDWVLQPAGGDYWFIINLKTGLFLTKDGGDQNVSNWGKTGSLLDNMKWRFEYSAHPPGVRTNNIPNDGTPLYSRKMRIYNKAGNALLTYSGGNVGIWEGPRSNSDAAIWRARASDATAFELQLRKFQGNSSSSEISSSLDGLFKLTITSVKAIKTSTGQDGATKVLFAGIDLAIDIGMGIATGGASAAGKAAGTAAIKGGARAVSRDAVVSAAKAAMRQKVRDSRSRIGRKGANILAGDPQGELEEYALSQLESGTEGGSLSGPTQALLAANDVLDALSSEAIFNKVYPSSPDDLDIYVNGFSIWPNGGRSKGRKISSQQTHPVNKEFIFEGDIGFRIDLYEYDYASDDDYMGHVRWYPWQKVRPFLDMIRGNTRQHFDNILISNDHEGSLYEISYYVEPLVPEILSEGRLRQKYVRPRIIERGCTSGSASDCLEHAKILSNYTGWATKPKYRDVAIDIFERACDEGNPNGCAELHSAAKTACQASNHPKSCRIHNDHVRQMNMSIWRINCEDGKGYLGECLKLANALHEGSRELSKEWDEALILFDGLCDKNHGNSCEVLKTLSTKMCDAGGGYGCDRRGALIWNGKDGLVDLGLAEEWITKGCDFKDETACLNTATLIRERARKAIDMDRIDLIERAIRKAELGCEYGSQKSCTRAKAYSSDLNDEKQQPYYRCSENHGPSCRIYGDAFLTASFEAGIDPDEALDLKTKARDAYVSGCRESNPDGVMDAHSCLGAGLLETYEGVDRSWGGTWFQYGCDLDNARACYEAGKYYADPNYNKYHGPDAEKARLAWGKGCELGHQDACSSLDNTSLFAGKLIERSSCEGYRQLRSTTSWDAKLTISNTGPDPIYLFWIDEKGTAVNYERKQGIPEATIEPGKTIVQFGHIGYAWLFTDINGNCYGTVVVEEDPAQQTLFTLYSYTITSAGGPYDGSSTQTTSANNGSTAGSGSGSSANLGTNQTAGLSPNSNQTQHQSGQTQSSQGTTSQTNASSSSTIQPLDSCGRLGQIVSNATGQTIDLTLKNAGTDPMYVYWVDQNGTEGDFNGGQDPVFTVNGGETLTVDAQIGDSYSVYDVNSDCAGVIPTLAVNTIFELFSNSTQTSSSQSNASLSNSSQSNSTQSSSLIPVTNSSSALQTLGSCNRLGSLVSSATGQTIDLTLQNSGADTMYVYWVDQNGTEGDFNGGQDPVFVVNSGETMTVEAQIGDSFSVYDVNSDCAGVIPTLASHAHYAMTGTSGSTHPTNNQISSSSSQNNSAASTQTQPSSNTMLRYALQMGEGCEMRGHVSSQGQTEGAEVSIINAGAETLYVYWLDEDGAEKNYSRQDEALAVLNSGETAGLPAYTGYYFSAFNYINNSWQCAGIFELSDMLAEVTFSGANQQGGVSGSQNLSSNSQDQSSFNLNDGTADYGQSGQNGAIDDQTLIELHSGTGCELREGSIQSSFDGSARVELNNYGSQILYVYWVNENGQEVDYRSNPSALLTLSPGETQILDTQVGFIHSVHALTGNDTYCVGAMQISSSDSSVNLYADYGGVLISSNQYSSDGYFDTQDDQYYDDSLEDDDDYYYDDDSNFD